MNTTDVALDTPSTKLGTMAPEPWYRQGWPWFLISIPLTSVLLGFLMLYLGLNTNNSLVVDDYYKQGKGINLRIERDRTASLLGLTAKVSKQQEGLMLDLLHSQQTVPSALFNEAKRVREAFEFPARLQLKFVHVTQADKDFDVLLDGIGNGRYLSPMTQMPEHGRWRIHIEPQAASDAGTQSWRLVGDGQTSFAMVDQTLIRASNPEDVFTRQMLTP